MHSGVANCSAINLHALRHDVWPWYPVDCTHSICLPQVPIPLAATRAQTSDVQVFEGHGVAEGGSGGGGGGVSL